MGKCWEGVKRCFGMWGKVRGGVRKCVGVWGRCEKVLGEVWGSVLGCDVGKCWGRCGKVCWMWKRCGGVEMCWKRCKKVCSGRCGKVLWGVGKDEERCGEVWESVFGWEGGEEKFGDVGKVWQSVLGCWGGYGRCGDVEKCWRRCGKVCWDVEEMWG